MNKFFGEKKSVYGMVSWDHSRFTLHHECVENCSSHTEGYSKKVFDGFNGPIIRCGKAKIGDVIESIKGPVIPIEGVDIPLCGAIPIPLEQYLDKMRSHNIPIEMGYQE